MDAPIQPVVITQEAAKRFRAMLNETGNEAFRFGIKGGGCSGFQYFLEFEKLENIEDGDEVATAGDVKVIVDDMSILYVLGTTIDWVEDIMGSHFSFKSPMEKSSCGCGTSVNFKVNESH